MNDDIDWEAFTRDRPHEKAFWKYSPRLVRETRDQAHLRVLSKKLRDAVIAMCTPTLDWVTRKLGGTP